MTTIQRLHRRAQRNPVTLFAFRLARSVYLRLPDMARARIKRRLLSPPGAVRAVVANPVPPRRPRPAAPTLRGYIPATAERGVFFLHVPKTAGSYLTSLFVDKLGAARCDPFMSRSVDAAALGDPDTPLRADYISAHVNFHMVKAAGLAARYGMIMILRDPVDRLVSHLNWIDRFNHGHDPRGYASLDADRKRLVAQLDHTDPQDAGALHTLFRLDGLGKATWLFNRQLATLVVKHPDDILEYTDMERMTDTQIAARMARIEVCTTLPQFLSGLRNRGVALPSEARVNPAQTKRFHRTPALERAAARYVALDARLYRLAQAQAPDLDRIAAMLSGHAEARAPERRVKAA